MIYIIRHTKPHVKKGMCYGWTDLDVAESFIDELEVIKEKTPDFKDYQILSSPLQRCYKLAKALCPDSNIEKDERIKEINFGDWEGRVWNNMESDLVKEWCCDFVNNRVPGGESFNDLYKRVESFWNDIDKKKDILIVAHDGVIRAFLCLLLDIPKENAFRFDFSYGTIIRVTPWELPHCKIAFL